MVLMMLCFVGWFQDEFLDYEKAFAEFSKSKRPIVIVVTTKTCRFCPPMKKEIKEIKKDYPNFILCEVSAEVAQKQFTFLELSKGVPQTFMYVYDNEDETIRRLPAIIGFSKKSQIYKSWGMPE
jgi:thioredoxin-related protein